MPTKGFARTLGMQEPQLESGETVLHEGPANRMARFEAVGGWLTLTNRRLTFRPHAVNVQKAPLDLPLEEISDVRPRRTLWLVPNGLLVQRAGGTEERFVVHARREWVAKIREACGLPS